MRWFAKLSVFYKVFLIGALLVVLVPSRPLAILFLIVLLGFGVKALIAWTASAMREGRTTAALAVTGAASVVCLLLVVDLAWNPGTPGEGERASSPADRENADQLLLEMRYEDPDLRTIEDVTVSGSSATVTVRRGLEEAEADYVCDYALDAANELYEFGLWETEDADFAGRLLEVTVVGAGTSTSCRLAG